MSSAPPLRLQRGANASLHDLMPALGTVVVGFGWRLIQGRGPALELVPSAVVCGRDGLALSDDHLVFFNQLQTPDDDVRLVEGDDIEQVEIHLRDVPDRVDKIVLVVYVDPDLRSPGSFGAVRDAYVRLTDRAGDELLRFDVGNSEADVNAMIFGEVYRHQGNWKFRAIGQGYADGLKGVAKTFGVAI